ncbi:RNA polymerase sigma factor FliA [Rhodocyclus tenuis]|uniref:RNA polymerase sigma factor FliA n=2 Tax=Rhodocyclus TaxID=1064 RepID=A0A6L5JX19_RHOTE|nr:RNA polymerase sigma factor FliA [Rhodocyclus gracilis]MQY51616.1 FliA/WhiG family RNA polymerase sigma factor [Rhodocyclus gracilis]MRD73097.1 FliA/WhiG family RNA polymerase sigma factor [Rhodocyclus gracilis]NJA89125.1 RNA polymerase sigma factor FliA [Rhodocyclus gracilis]
MYTAAGQPDTDQLVQRFTPLVKRIAYHLMSRLPASVQVDDLVQNGMLGLLDAISRFESGLGAQFETYAAQRIRGAMLDGLRENDWLPRSLRRDFRRVEATIARLEQENGRAPSEQELAAALDMSLADYQKMLQEARGHQIIYFEDMTDEAGEDFLERHFTDDSADPLNQLEDRKLRESLVKGIEALPEREKLMMALYYEQDLNLREIGEVMGVTESRVCQLHTQAVARLRSRLFGEKSAAGKGARKEPRRG